MQPNYVIRSKTVYDLGGAYLHICDGGVGRTVLQNGEQYISEEDDTLSLPIVKNTEQGIFATGTMPQPG